MLYVVLFIKKKTLKSEKYYQRFTNVSQIKSEEKTCNKQHRTDSKERSDTQLNKYSMLAASLQYLTITSVLQGKLQTVYLLHLCL